MAQNLDELFDVVDGQDRVTGQLPRREVHRRGLRHRAVHLLVVNRAGQIFLQQRSTRKDLFPGAWDSSAAGHVGAGEDYDGAARRELAEELGCRPVRPPQRLFKIEARAETGQEFVRVYRVEAEGPFTLEPDEIERGDWFTVAEIDRWLVERPGELAPAFAFIWARARGSFIPIGSNTPELAPAWMDGMMRDGKSVYSQAAQRLGVDVSFGVRGEVSAGRDECAGG